MLGSGSNPVNGSFRPPDAVLAVLVAGAEPALVVVAAWLPGVTADVVGAVVAEGVGLVELGLVEGVDLWVWECRPASGSTYCWSPAEPPPAAIALPGARAARQAATATPPTPCIHRFILRVWQALPPLASSGPRRGLAGAGSSRSGWRRCRRGSSVKAAYERVGWTMCPARRT
jgi:hypothetical protein